MSDLDLAPLADAITVRSGSASLAVEVAGDGPSVGFLHAGVADRRSWRPVMAPLAADHRVIAWDRRGFGDTVVDTPEPYDHVRDLRAVLDALGVDRVVLVGNSQGGRTALDAALTVPDRVAGLMMVGAAWTGGPYEPDPPEVAALGHALEAAEAAGDLHRVNAVEARIWLDGVQGLEGRVTGPARELFLEMNGRALAMSDPGEEQRHPDAWGRLAELAMPVTIVDGALDEATELAVGRAAAEQVADARHVVLDEVGHLPSLERPLVLAELVRDLVERAR